MIYYPTKLNEIARRANDATAAWIATVRDSKPNESELKEKVEQISDEMDQEELRLRSEGLTLLYNFDKHVYYALNDIKTVICI